MTLRMPCGGGIYGGQTHSQSPEAMFTQVCGLRTVMPSNPYDAKGLLIAAIENDDPVIFLEPKRLYNGPFDGHHERPVTPWSKHPASAVPDGYYTVPLDCAAIVRPGTEVTILTYGTTVYVAQVAAEETGIDAEVIDLRSLCDKHGVVLIFDEVMTGFRVAWVALREPNMSYSSRPGETIG